jgi:hypothetical protein
LVEQSNITGIRKGIPSFNKALFDEVYKVKFRLIRPAVTALRFGKTKAFDDLYYLNSQLDQDAKQLMKQLLKIANDQKLKGDAAKQLKEEIDKYLPEYKLTIAEATTIKRLKKEAEMTVTSMESQTGEWVIPI